MRRQKVCNSDTDTETVGVGAPVKAEVSVKQKQKVYFIVFWLMWLKLWHDIDDIWKTVVVKHSSVQLLMHIHFNFSTFCGRHIGLKGSDVGRTTVCTQGLSVEATYHDLTDHLCELIRHLKT